MHYPSNRGILSRLYFGASRADRGLGAVTAREFQSFVARKIVPEFPDGFTLTTGAGQWSGGAESSWVLSVVFHRNDFDSATAAIERIRHAYRAEFAQESVLRVDTDCAFSF